MLSNLSKNRTIYTAFPAQFFLLVILTLFTGSPPPAPPQQMAFPEPLNPIQLVLPEENMLFLPVTTRGHNFLGTLPKKKFTEEEQQPSKIAINERHFRDV